MQCGRPFGMESPSWQEFLLSFSHLSATFLGKTLMGTSKQPSGPKRPEDSESSGPEVAEYHPGVAA